MMTLTRLRANEYSVFEEEAERELLREREHKDLHAERRGWRHVVTWAPQSDFLSSSTQWLCGP